MIRDLAAVTMTVPAERLDSIVTLYGDLFGWRVAFNGALDRSLAAQWGVERLPRRVVVLRAGDDRRGVMRLVEGPTPCPAPFATYGWAVPEVSVRGVDALHDRIRQSPHFRVNGAPRDLKFSDEPASVRAMQAVGPLGEQWYLTEVLRQIPGRELMTPPDGMMVGNTFIAVVVTDDFAATRAFYTETLGMEAYISFETTLSVATRELGWPEETVFDLAAVKPRDGGETRIEIDGFRRAIKPRARRAGELPPGFGIASFFVDDLDAQLQAVADAGHAVLGPPLPHDEPPYDGARATTVIAPGGELVELIEGG